MKDIKPFQLDLAQNILEPISDKDILTRIIDPTTNKPYDGLIFKGEFASMDVLNNNNRIYTEENYIPLIEQMRQVIFSTRGLYGHLEHGAGYPNNYNLCSHRILDIWYDKKQKKVFGTIMLLNTPIGKIAQEIYKSGGCFAISGRGGGVEKTNADGSITALLKLLVTFDIVYHPGFTTAEQIGCTLMESANNWELSSGENITEIFENYVVNFDNKKDTESVNPLFESFASLHKYGFGVTPMHDFGGAYIPMFESEQQQAEIEKLQDGTPPNEQKIEDELQNAVDEQLNESKQIFKENQQKNFEKLGASVYDNSAGFLITEEEKIIT